MARSRGREKGLADATMLQAENKSLKQGRTRAFARSKRHKTRLLQEREKLKDLQAELRVLENELIDRKEEERSAEVEREVEADAWETGGWGEFRSDGGQQTFSMQRAIFQLLSIGVHPNRYVTLLYVLHNDDDTTTT